MGLDITAYRKLAPALDAAIDEDGNPVIWGKFVKFSAEVLAWTERHFPGRTQGINAGIYAPQEHFGFRAGSYGGYNVWRDQLARYSGYGSAKSVWESSAHGPFIELINFPDNEGVIGPIVAAKLAKDFADNAERIKMLANGDDYFISKYRDWQKAFEMATDAGAVEFH